MDARRQPSIQNAPQVLFSKEPPLELKPFALPVSDTIGYVTFGNLIDNSKSFSLVILTRQLQWMDVFHESNCFVITCIIILKRLKLICILE